MTVHVNWHEDVACRDADPDLFFPIGTTGAPLRQMEEAKRICRDCPVCKSSAWAGRWRTGPPMAYGEAPRRTSGASSGACQEKRQPLGQTAMTRVITQQSAENMAYVRKLLKLEMPGQVSASEGS